MTIKNINIQGTSIDRWLKIPMVSYQIRKIADCACTGNAGNVFPAIWLQWKPPVSDHGMHHGTCVTHVPWCMSGSLTGAVGENVPGIPGACATRNFMYLAIGPWWKAIMYMDAVLVEGVCRKTYYIVTVNIITTVRFNPGGKLIFYHWWCQSLSPA